MDAAPLVIEPIVLEGVGVRLEPLVAARHQSGLAAAIRDGSLWRVKETVVPHPDELDGFFAFAETQGRAGRELAFATVDVRTGAVVRSTRFREIDTAHRRAEIGFTFIAASLQRSHVNTEAKLLMLSQAFDAWGLHRVELLTGHLVELVEAVG